MLYRPRHGPADIPPLLRLWCDAQGLPAPSDISTPHLAYQPFWRFASQGRPRLFPAWPALEARWTDLPTPDAEQVIFDPSIVGTARLVEPTVAEVAARNRVYGGGAASAAAGDLVHVPFYEVQATVGTGRLAVNVEACSGRVYPERMPPEVRASSAPQATTLTTGIAGFLVVFLEAMLIPPVWLAGAAVGLTALALYWAIIGGEGRAGA
ncbi:MAG TPA: hypothetical protein VGC81_09880 [Candidatus Methylomirabilis sp.]